MRPDAWSSSLALSGYAEAKPFETQRILDGIRHGVRVDFVGDRSVPRFGRNLPILDEHRAKVTKVIEADVAAGKKAGPFDVMPCAAFVVSPIGAVPKKDPGKIRVIHHLSFPFGGESVNADIRDEEFSLARFADAARAVVALGPGCFLIKLDVEAAYKQVPVHPDDWHLLGFMWNGKYYYERVLPFGLKSSCRIWEWYAAALHHFFVELGVEVVIHYIDDFLFVIKSRDEAAEALRKALDLCVDLGIPMAPAKTEGPCTSLTFLGIELDTVQMEARLPSQKLDEIRRLALVWAGKSLATVRELQSIAGVLVFAASVVRPGRFFVRSFFALASRMEAALRPGELRHVQWALTDDCRADIAWWGAFIPHWNGTSLLLEQQWTDAPRIEFFSDACTTGYGAVYGREWFAGQWNDDHRAAAMRSTRESMPFYEMFALVAAALTWGRHWSGKKIIFRADCQPVVQAVTKGASRDPGIMHLLRALARSACLHGYDFRAEHIAGVQNVVADELSRGGDSTQFRSLCPLAHTHPTPVIAPSLPSPSPLSRR